MDAASLFGIIRSAVERTADAALKRASSKCWAGHILYKKRLREQVDAIRFQLKHNRYVTSYVPLLHELRKIFILHRELLQDGDNVAFFSEWLSMPIVELRVNAGAEFWTLEKIQKLRNDLDDLHV